MHLTSRTSLVLAALFAFIAVGCGPSMIPNTTVPDTTENRDVVTFMEEYRRAMEQMDVQAMLAMASPAYFDHNGTPTGEDDYDYDALRDKFNAFRERVIEVRYEIKYRNVEFDGDRIYVRYTYTSSFRVEAAEGPRWERRLKENRAVLTKNEDSGEYQFLSGM